MKIYINCKSPLLQKSLEIFLRPKLASATHADMIVSDYEINTSKPVLIVGSHKKATLKTPFSKAKLLATVERIIDDYEMDMLIKRGSDSFEEELNQILADFAKKLKKSFAKRLHESITQNKN